MSSHRLEVSKPHYDQESGVYWVSMSIGDVSMMVRCYYKTGITPAMFSLTHLGGRAKKSAHGIMLVKCNGEWVVIYSAMSVAVD